MLRVTSKGSGHYSVLLQSNRKGSCAMFNALLAVQLVTG
jgi:hypothetical protein